MKLLVTGTAGYIAGLLIEKLSSDASVEKMICIDELPQPQRFAGNAKIQWIQTDLAVHGWEDAIAPDEKIDAVVHCAYKIRNPYGKTKLVEENNTAACLNDFAFTFERAIPRLVYLSSVAAYGAKPANIGKLLKESEPTLETENPYGYQKALSERVLAETLAAAPATTQLFVLRLNSVTGPRGQSMSSKFGLITFLKKLLPFIVEAHPAWARQFVHEDDVVGIIELLTTKGFSAAKSNPEVFNVAPEKFLTARDMAAVLGKKTVHIPAWSVKPLFWIAWNISFGKIPTRPDSAQGLIYPINVDGTHINDAGFHYAHTAEEAFLAKK